MLASVIRNVAKHTQTASAFVDAKIMVHVLLYYNSLSFRLQYVLYKVNEF